MKKKILVTGGAGFLGSHLCRKLLENDKNEIICLDNLFTGSKDNISSLLKNPRFEFIRHDITYPIIIEVDEIYNLACPASPIHYQYDPIKTIKTNILGALHVLGIAKRTNAKVLQASTSEIYGDPIMHPQKEDYFGNVNVLSNRACYDEGKRCAETLFNDYLLAHNIKIKIARIFNTYGPNMSKHDGRVVSNFVIRAIKNKDLEINGDGTITRSFCYVDDLINGLVKLMSSENNINYPINLGNENETTLKNLAKLIIKKSNSKSTISFKEKLDDDPIKRNPNTDLAKKVLNWEAKIDLEEGIEKTISFFRKDMQ